MTQNVVMYVEVMRKTPTRFASIPDRQCAVRGAKGNQRAYGCERGVALEPSSLSEVSPDARSWKPVDPEAERYRQRTKTLEAGRKTEGP